LSPDWPTGEIKGVRARGGIEVDLTWRAGKLATATLRAAAPGSVKVRYGKLATSVLLAAGEPALVRLVDGVLVQAVIPANAATGDQSPSPSR
jgi:hypothetical protein